MTCQFSSGDLWKFSINPQPTLYFFMINIEQPKTDTRQRVTILHRKDLEVSHFCGPGHGGQAKNKVASGVMIRHPESGAIGRASDSRSEPENKKAAFERLLKDPRMKFFLAKAIYEVKAGEKLEKTVDKETADKNLKYEVKNEAGQWVEVPASYFETAGAQLI